MRALLNRIFPILTMAYKHRWVRLVPRLWWYTKPSPFPYTARNGATAQRLNRKVWRIYLEEKRREDGR